MPQATCRMTDEKLKHFNHACILNNTTAQRVLDSLVTAYTEAAHQGNIIHLDGSLCPVSALIQGLVVAAKVRMSLDSVK
jgi:hypothetical protein